MQTLAAWLLAYLLAVPAVAPIHESDDARLARLTEVAQDIAAVALDPNEPDVVGGPYGRINTGLLLAMTFRHESRLDVQIDLGLNRARRIRSGDEDHGRSFCGLQVMVGQGQQAQTRPWNAPRQRPWLPTDPEPATRWTGQQLLANRRSCIRAGLHVLKLSWGACGPHDARRLQVYASGSCGKALKLSADRMSEFRWASYARRHPVVETASLSIFAPTLVIASD